MAACLQISLVYTGSSDQTTDAASDLTQDGEIGARNYFFFFPSPLFEVQSRGEKNKKQKHKTKTTDASVFAVYFQHYILLTVM